MENWQSVLELNDMEAGSVIPTPPTVINNKVGGGCNCKYKLC